MKKDYHKPAPKKPTRPLTEEQRSLAEAYIPMARKMAKTLKWLMPRWCDEFESAAMVALVEAARSYDPSRNIRFATFARFRIRGALMDVRRYMGAEMHVVTMSTLKNDGVQAVLVDRPPPVGSECDDEDSVEHWLRKLPARHAQVCRLHYLYGKTTREIAEAMGCSQSDASRLRRLSIKLLSPAFDDAGNPITRAIRRRNRKVKPCPLPSELSA